MPKDPPGNPGGLAGGEGPRARVSGMQTKLHRWATADPGRRFDDLFNFVYDPATLLVAFDRVAGNTGSRTAGVDGLTVADGTEEPADVVVWTGGLVVHQSVIYGQRLQVGVDGRVQGGIRDDPEPVLGPLGTSEDHGRVALADNLDDLWEGAAAALVKEPERLQVGLRRPQQCQPVLLGAGMGALMRADSDCSVVLSPLPI